MRWCGHGRRGGWLGDDKILGAKRVIMLLGAVVLAIGYALVARDAGRRRWHRLYGHGGYRCGWLRSV